MRRIVLLAVSHCIGLTAFCQSPAGASGPSLNLFENSSLPQSFFVATGNQASKSFFFKMPSCEVVKADRRQQTTQPDPTRPFEPPCLDPQIFALNAQNNMQAPPLPAGRRPHAKSIPIPTQWPDAKFEQIPTDWPNLKLLPVEKPTATLRK